MGGALGVSVAVGVAVIGAGGVAARGVARVGMTVAVGDVGDVGVTVAVGDVDVGVGDVVDVAVTDAGVVADGRGVAVGGGFGSSYSSAYGR